MTILDQGSPAPGGQPGSIEQELGTLNCHRITRLAAIMVLTHLAHVVVFWPYTPGATETVLVWRNGIILGHSVMLAFAVVTGLAAFTLERTGRTTGLAAALLAEVVALSYLLFGVVVAVVDQRVTAAITPLMVASIGVAVTLVLRPLMAGVNYATMLTAFLFAAPMTQTEPLLLLSVRVNSITTTALGFGVAMVLWRSHVLGIRHQRQILEQQRRLQVQNQELVHLATCDVLTGTLNRSQLFEEADQELVRMRRTAQKACLVILDIDHFKGVNDTHGHPVGDATLKAVAHLLSDRLRGTDVLARIGGEEFAVLLRDTSLHDGMEVAERLRAAVSEHLFDAGPRRFEITLSLGVAEMAGDQPGSVDDWYRAADGALYQAKGDGRNCVRSAPVQPNATCPPVPGEPASL